MGPFTDLRSSDGFSFPAYIAQPAGKARGGIVVLQEIFGVNSHIRAVTDGYAADGYLAVAPATFQRVKPDVDFGYGAEDRNAGMALKTAAEGAATQCYVATHPSVADISGEYFEDCNLARPSERARDSALAARLWEESERIVREVTA